MRFEPIKFCRMLPSDYSLDCTMPLKNQFVCLTNRYFWGAANCKEINGIMLGKCFNCCYLHLITCIYILAKPFFSFSVCRRRRRLVVIIFGFIETVGCAVFGDARKSLVWIIDTHHLYKEDRQLSRFRKNNAHAESNLTDYRLKVLVSSR